MAYLARSGYDVFALDFTGYGRSTRPVPMDDPCNVAAEQQHFLVPGILEGPCPPSYPAQLVTAGSELDDLHAVVDYVRRLRHIDRVHLIAWSVGAPRAANFAARFPEQVETILLLAPSYNPASTPPESVPASGAPMGVVTQQESEATWDRQVGCEDQFDPAIRAVIWDQLMASDPVGARWGPGVARAPRGTGSGWAWNAHVASQVRAPTLIISGDLDGQSANTSPSRARQAYEDLAPDQKLFFGMPCSSHNAIWERRHLLLFQASAEWLDYGSVQGLRNGVGQLED